MPQPQYHPVHRSTGQAAIEGHADVHGAALHVTHGEINTGFDPSASNSEFSNLFDDFLQGEFLGYSGMSDIDGLMWEIFNSAAP
jgi:hypothetical protein